MDSTLDSEVGDRRFAPLPRVVLQKFAEERSKLQIKELDLWKVSSLLNTLKYFVHT